MNARRGKLVSGGRLQVPADIRRALSLSDGDAVLMRVVDGELHVLPARDRLKRIQRLVRGHVPDDGRSWSDELISERRAEFEHE